MTACPSLGCRRSVRARLEGCDGVTTDNNPDKSSSVLARPQACANGAQPLTAGVVVCAFTRARWSELAAGVRELAAQSLADDRVVVVIDHNDPLRSRAEVELAGPRVTVLANAGEVGLSAGRNTGVEVCDTDVVLFLDDDAFPSPGWISAYRQAFAAHDDVVAIGGAVVPRWEGGRAPRWFPDEFGWVVGCDYRGLPPSGSEIRNPIGASMGIRRRAFDVTGGFTTAIGRVGTVPLGCEETELAIRIRRLMPHSRIIRDTAPTVRHLVPRARQRVGYFVSRCYHEGQSKAVVARIAGTSAGLSSERSYATKTLVSGVGRHLGAALRGDVYGLARAAMLPVGFAATVAGFVKRRVREQA